jgi:hypothetical protein
MLAEKPAVGSEAWPAMAGPSPGAMSEICMVVNTVGGRSRGNYFGLENFK